MLAVKKAVPHRDEGVDELRLEYSRLFPRLGVGQRDALNFTGVVEQPNAARLGEGLDLGCRKMRCQAMVEMLPSLPDVSGLLLPFQAEGVDNEGHAATSAQNPSGRATARSAAIRAIAGRHFQGIERPSSIQLRTAPWVTPNASATFFDPPRA